MSFDDTPSPLERTIAQLNAELTSAEVYRFPDAFILRRPAGPKGDQVAVTHQGDTTLYATPEALAAAVRANDPRHAELAGQLAGARRLQAEALELFRAAKAAQAAAERRLAFIGFASFVILVGAVLVALAVIL